MKSLMHAENVGDCFTSSIVYSFLCDYYETISCGERKDFWNRRTIHDEFYIFLKDIFSNPESYQDFLKKIRTTLLESDSVYLKDVSHALQWQILLMFEELHLILSRQWDIDFDIASYFETKLEHISFSEIDTEQIPRDVSRLPLEAPESILDFLSLAIKNRCAITDEWKIVGLVSQVQDGVFQVIHPTSGEVSHVNKYGTELKNSSKGRHFLSAHIPDWYLVH